jgi:flagellin-like protein
MKNLRHSRKALSPVVASIILIAVTVAVSIAVAAWMGALTTGFMGSSSLTVTDAQFTGDEQDTIVLTIKNTGTKTVTLAAVKVNGKTINNFELKVENEPVESIEAGAKGTLTITNDWSPGDSYRFDLYDGSGQVVGSYHAVPPA